MDLHLLLDAVALVTATDGILVDLLEDVITVIML